MKNTESSQSLQSLREESKLTFSQIIKKASPIDSEFPQTHNGVIRMEERGTRDYWKIKALSVVYDRPMDTIARIAKPTTKKCSNNLSKTLASNVA